MQESTLIANVADRPRLHDYLLVAEREALDVGLRLWVGAIEVGLVGIAAGRVVFAELPGALGDEALRVLASLPEARLVPEIWTDRPANVDSPWRTLVPGSERSSEADRRQRLAAARDAMRNCLHHDCLHAEFDPRTTEWLESESPNSEALRVEAELLDWAAIDAYLAGDLARARQLLERSTQLFPSNSQPGPPGVKNFIRRANLEILRLRLLDEDLELGGLS